MESRISVEIAAPAELVFRLAHDVERWPRLLPHYARATVLERGADRSLVAEFVARRALPGPLGLLGLSVPVAWRSRTWNEPEARRLRFRHLGGATAGMDVTWRIEPLDAMRTHVSIEHDFRPAVPGWAAFVDRFFTRPIAGRTLATFRAIAEALTDESARASSANQPT